jgi:hypothetical protein
VTFLTQTPGMTPNEARLISALHELVLASVKDGPVPLELYASIRGVNSEKPASWERSARRLVRELTGLGFFVEALGDGDSMAIDFGKDTALRRELEQVVDEATKWRSNGVGPISPNAEESDVTDGDKARSPEVPTTGVTSDYALGMTVKALCRRYGVGEHRMQSILVALRVERRKARPLRLEERRCAEAVERALDQPKKRGFVRNVALALGCHRHTASSFLRRLGVLRRPAP